jgi:hypothetical protein
VAAELDPAVRRMVVSLRTVKDEAGLSTTALAGKTPYSRSAWDRYLNGRAFPPRGAVAALVRVAGADEARLLAEWELADSARTAAVPAGSAPPLDGPEVPADATGGSAAGAGGRRRWGVVAAGVVVIAAAVVVGAMWLTGGDQPAPRAASAATRAAPPDLTCHLGRTGGRLYAGHSTTSDRLVAMNGAGQDVVEVQCLLKQRGFDPGRVDGLFGEHTATAVKQFQHAAGTPADGIVGPQTWALRRG